MRRLRPSLARYARWVRPEPADTAGIRTVDVRPPSRGHELEWVCNGALLVCLGVIYVLAFQTFRPPGLPGRDPAAAVLPYQVLFRDLPGGQQRALRSMQEGLVEALRLRARDGTWPAVDALAAEGVPPFAADPLDRAPLVWTQRSAGLVVEYVGIPDGPVGAAFLILIQEPAPGRGEQPARGVVDEEHQLLPGGMLLHVTYWKREGAPPGRTVITDPALAGWSQIRITSPFQVGENG